MNQKVHIPQNTRPITPAAAAPAVRPAVTPSPAVVKPAVTPPDDEDGEEFALMPDGRRELKVGDKVRLRAVYGFIENPNTLVKFDTDKSHKVEVDMWAKLEYEAGKLALVDD